MSTTINVLGFVSVYMAITFTEAIELVSKEGNALLILSSLIFMSLKIYDRFKNKERD